MSSTNKHIFHEPSGKRWKKFKTASTICALIASILGAALCFTIFLLPITPMAGNTVGGFRNFTLKHENKEAARQKFLAERSEKRLMHRIKLENRIRKPGKGAAHAYDTVVGFYVNWEPTSFDSFRKHIDALTYVMPQWLSLNDDAGGFSSTYSETTRDPEMVKLAVSHRVPIIPVLDNSNDTDFQWKPLKNLLKDPDKQRKLVQKIKNYLLKNHYAGVNLDFEPPYDFMNNSEISESKQLLKKNLPQFVELLKNTLKPEHLMVTEDVPAWDGNFDYSRLSDLNDLVIVMLYDQHTPTDDPGPIASQQWIEETADKLFSLMDSSKVILGVGNYCYDWPVQIDAKDRIHKGGKGKEQLMGAALNIARESGSELQMDDPDRNPYFFYVDSNNRDHVIYMLDAVTAYNEIQALRGYNPRGAALWYLGSEDPTIWSFMDDDKLSKSIHLDSLKNVNFRSTLNTEMDTDAGELLEIAATSTPGSRKFTTDQDGLIDSETYQKYPTPYIVRQFGTQKRVVALTFDDGPDPEYTPKILDVLKKNHVHGTFFVIGQAAAQNPEIIRRLWNEGNELGNHTYTHPHIALASPLRARMEVNATERIIESITGHSTLLFRPPFGEFADTSTVEDVDIPLLLQMQKKGYVTVGMNIDPKDYLKPSPSYIVNQVNKQLGDNHIILLHDGGGNRDNTIKALPSIIRNLKKKGYQFVTVSQMMGPGWYGKLFPLVTGRQKRISGFDEFVFEIVYTINDLLHILFIIAILLGILRIVYIAPLSIRQTLRNRKIAKDSHYTPSVTVAIPAFNEGNVVCNTVESVLRGNYPDLQVIVVDDGSTDNSSELLHHAFDKDPRVKIITKENGGKSTALNLAFQEATSEIVVCMDADTIFASDTIQNLVRQFQDPKVGAVAGNVKVGNRINLLTIWQSLEYITSQNFDRQAFAELNSVAVVPGAVGAWRRSIVMEVGGFETDTLAEDTDLTFKIRVKGYYTRSDNEALAYTEAPDNVAALAKQRFRWAFGILQVLWKHRKKLFSPQYGAFSMLVMPSMWVFNILLQALAPIVDITVIASIFSGQLLAVLYYTAALFVLDFVSSFIAVELDQENPWDIVWLFWQRFFYRQFMYYIIIKALTAAVRGGIVGWGKLQRKATVSLPK